MPEAEVFIDSSNRFFRYYLGTHLRQSHAHLA
jgi:hypothetical protein